MIDLEVPLEVTTGIALTIEGPGASLLTIGCGGSGFTVAAGASLNLSGVSMTDADEQRDRQQRHVDGYFERLLLEPIAGEQRRRHLEFRHGDGQFLHVFQRHSLQ